MARTILIVGGGVAGWMAAAALSRTPDTRVTLIEKGDSPGFAMSAGPMLRDFHALLGIDENDFLAATRGTLRLGTRFIGPGFDYIQAYADFGASLDGVPFHQLWLKLHAANAAGDIGDYNLGVTAARLGRFARPTRERRATLDYGYHFDGRLYAAYLRLHSPGVVRHRGEVGEVKRDRDRSIESVTLDDGGRFEADLYVDCSGIPAAADWEAWPELPSILATVSGDDLSPFSTVTCADGAWRSIVPLQHGDGGEQILAFAPGRLNRPWQGNCVAIGHAAASVPPLETSEADLIALDLARFAANPDADRYNKIAVFELTQIRDFTALQCQAEMSESLRNKVERFRSNGDLPPESETVYRPSIWLAALLGRGVVPRRWDSRANALDTGDTAGILRRYAMLIRHSTQSMPRHADYIAHHCPASAPSARAAT